MARCGYPPLRPKRPSATACPRSLRAASRKTPSTWDAQITGWSRRSRATSASIPWAPDPEPGCASASSSAVNLMRTQPLFALPVATERSELGAGEFEGCTAPCPRCFLLRFGMDRLRIILVFDDAGCDMRGSPSSKTRDFVNLNKVQQRSHPRTSWFRLAPKRITDSGVSESAAGLLRQLGKREVRQHAASR